MNQGHASEPPLPPGLEIARRVMDGVLVIAITGEIDMDTAPAVAAAVNTCIDEARDGPCVLDLTAVTFLNSAGLTMLLETTDRAEALHEPLPIIVDANRPVIRPIQVTGLDNELTLYHTVEEALKAHKPTS